MKTIKIKTQEEIVSMKREIILIKKIAKLKALILLVDGSVSDVQMNELSLRQWSEYIKCFPDEGEK